MLKLLGAVSIMFFLPFTYVFSLDLFYYEEFLFLVIPTVSYKNVEEEKTQLIKDNKGKSGVYRWTNKINGKIYIGSSSDLGRRLSEYFRPSKLRSSNMRIYNAILKYGISNFLLDIIKYVDQDILEEVEQSYINALKPEYNLSPTAGSNLGYKWTDEQIAKKEAYYKTEAGLAHLDRVFRKDGKWSDARRTSCPVSIGLKVTEISTGVVSNYASIRLAAEALGVTQQALSKRFKTNSSFVLKGLYLIEKGGKKRLVWWIYYF